jgi:sugar phosphate isomerase/epimerase
MKFGMSTLGCPGWTLERVAEAAREYGYQGVELRILDDEIITPAVVRQNKDRIRALFGDGRLDLIALGTSIRVSVAGDDERAANERDLREFVDLASELRVPLIRVFGGRFPAGEDEAAAVARAAETLEHYGAIAEPAGVVIALETHDDFSRSATVAATLSRVPRHSVGALWDTHHPYRMGEDVAAVWRNLADRLVHVHIKDARRRADGQWDLVLLGQGEVPCREIIRALALRGYRGYVVAEWEKKWHPEIADPEVALPQHIAVLREWTADIL